MQSISYLDRKAFFRLFNKQTSKRKLTLIKLVSKIGDGPAYVLCGGCLYLVNSVQSHSALLALIFAFALERPVYFLLKNTFKRERPSQSIVDGFIIPSDQFSLPSGHSSAAWLFSTVVVWHFPQFYSIYLMALAISLSRIMLGVHYPCDVIVGALLGCSFAFFGIYGATL